MKANIGLEKIASGGAPKQITNQNNNNNQQPSTIEVKQIQLEEKKQQEIRVIGPKKEEQKIDIENQKLKGFE